MQEYLNIIFLGACEKASYVNYSKTNLGADLGKWNVIGLRSIILAYIFPLSLKGIIFGFAVKMKEVDDQCHVTIKSRDGKELGVINITTRIDAEVAKEYDGNANSMLVPLEGWATTFFRINDANLIVDAPGDYFLTINNENEVQIIGQVGFYVASPPPLTAERISAIKSDPTSAKVVQITLGCKNCSDQYKIYASLDNSKSKLTEGAVLYSSVPDKYVCKCNETVIDLEYIRNNLYGLLGQRISNRLDMAFLPLYEKSTLEEIKRKFIKLIEADEPEETMQIFIQNNPILLHQFPSEIILHKPQILTKYKADFGIVSPNKTLILIEIEKTSTNILKKSGDAHSELNHAFGQVRDWLHVCNEHRMAAIESMNLEKEQVSRIEGVVIAGRDLGCDAKHLRKLKGYDWGNISFLTYDDLLFALDTLIGKIESVY